MADFDSPFCKVLAQNDLPSALGHQSGMVIPREIRPYLPFLDETSISITTPTVDELIEIEMYGPAGLLGSSVARYQYQTWGGTRSPESRLTTPPEQPRDAVTLRDLLSEGKPDDILLFERRRGTTDQYRLTLVDRESAMAREIRRSLGDNKRWGVLDQMSPPMTAVQFEVEISGVETGPNAPIFIGEAERSLTTSQRYARSDAFRIRVKRVYAFRCCICGLSLRTPEDYFEVEAAHIVPVGKSGNDVVPNGLSLCRTHHWSFDRGLLWVSPELTVHVSDAAIEIPENAPLRSFDGQGLCLPDEGRDYPNRDALGWHAENIARISRA